MRRTVHMVPQFLALVLCAGSAFAQRLVDPAQLPETVKNFDLRLQAGYVVRAPVTTPTGVGHQWNLVLRPSPIGTSHPSFYFTDSIDIPTASRPDFVATVRGLFLVGEGQYHAAFSLLDDLGRTCRQKWTLSANPPQNDRVSEAMLPPNTAADLSFLSPRNPSANSGPHPHRITIIQNVLPAASRHVRPSRPDGLKWLLTQWGVLITMLEALLEQISADSVRVVGYPEVGRRRASAADSDERGHGLGHGLKSRL